MILTCKYGFDGSSGHSLYKQKFHDPDMTDEFVYFIAMCPLKLSDRQTKKVLWCNPRTSSTLFCRPIKFLFAKETSTLVIEEHAKIKTDISNLESLEILVYGKNVKICYEMLLTMLDGSTINTLSETNSAQTCFICGATPKGMNSHLITDKPIRVENLNFGMTSLHMWIRSFECLLHIAYRLPLKCWQVKGPENKAVFETRKKYIQSEFKNKMGLLVDKPKAGSGSTNDGNTARSFFRNPELTSSITGVDEQLIKSFLIILRTISSGKQINIEKFEELLEDTRNLYLSLYAWYYMPSSVHRLLVHGIDIIKNFDLPIGQLSEDALEARHKEIRKQRLSHTRKSSRTNTNKDLMTQLLITSDPYIASLRKITSTSADLSGIEDYIIIGEDYDLSSDSESHSFLENVRQLSLPVSEESDSSD